MVLDGVAPVAVVAGEREREKAEGMHVELAFLTAFFFFLIVYGGNDATQSFPVRVPARLTWLCCCCLEKQTEGMYRKAYAAMWNAATS